MIPAQVLPARLAFAKDSLHVIIIYPTIVKPQFISAEPFFINNTHHRSLDNGPHVVTPSSFNLKILYI